MESQIRVTQVELDEYLRSIWVGPPPTVYMVPYAQGPRSRVGCPDTLLCIRGRFVTVEWKRPGESPSDRQNHEMTLIRAAEGSAFVVFSRAEFLKLVKYMLVSTEPIITSMVP